MSGGRRASVGWRSLTVCVCVRLQQVRQQVYRLALQCFSTALVVSACVCFCELLGVCSLTLRVDVRALNAILQHRGRQHAASTPAQHLHALGSVAHSQHANAARAHTLI